ncbi:replication initiation protein [Methylovulum psychrotolerans]|uniref:Replication initiation protein n=1 Tax=Methylovulum psychrotolerans TaxID=1704499 RepID=A0A2S5CG65_9GAMM|nr:replication initiation protein [Methylovulum psychrotolerans]POZ49798.1 replication initiation protein [Methylovulum psychrotolerans]
MIEMSEKTLVVQHNALVEARYKMTIEEQRVLKTIISQIHSYDEDFKLYEIRVLDLARLIGVSDEYYYSRIKSLLSKLRKSTLLIVDENGDSVETGWLSSITYRQGKGVVAIRFDPILKPYLLQLKSLFTSYELGNILRLRGMYSIRIYELLKQYEKISKREFSLDEFKKTLHIDSEYAQYRDLKKYVLIPSEKEVSKNTDISFSIEEKKQGRKVIGLTFHIKSKKRLQVISGEENNSDNISVDQLNTKAIFYEKQVEEIKEEPKNAYIQQLVDLGVTSAVAVDLVAEYDAERIERCISLTKENSHVKNQAAYVVVAIQRGFIDPKAEEKAKGAELLRLAEQREQLKKSWEKVKARYEDWKTRAVDAALQEMATAEIEEYRRQFMNSQKGVMRDAINRSEESKKRHFLLYMRGKLSLDSLDVWALKNAVDLSAFPDDMRR